MRTRQELTKALQETEGPMKVTSECLYKREGRRVRKITYLQYFIPIISWDNIQFKKV